MDMQIVAWLAAALVFASFFMKTIVPLRTVAILSNGVFICYALLGLQHGIFDKVLPILVLHLALLPLNIIRLNEASGALRSIRALPEQSKSHDFLTPYMTRRTESAGTFLFNRGDHADTVFLVISGTIHLLDIDKHLVAGDMLGEVAIFSDDATFSTTAVCEVDCELFAIRGKAAMELFYVDKSLAFQFARAIALEATVTSARSPSLTAEPTYC